METDVRIGDLFSQRCRWRLLEHDACRLVCGYQCFGRAGCFHVQGGPRRDRA